MVHPFIALIIVRAMKKIVLFSIVNDATHKHRLVQKMEKNYDADLIKIYLM
jgi:hypothetical protein